MFTAQVLQDNEGQFVILPEECRFEGDMVQIEQLGNCILLSPVEEPHA